METQNVPYMNATLQPQAALSAKLRPRLIQEMLRKLCDSVLPVGLFNVDIQELGGVIFPFWEPPRSRHLKPDVAISVSRCPYFSSDLQDPPCRAESASCLASLLQCALLPPFSYSCVDNLPRTQTQPCPHS
jgi:hypothetical protein